MKYKNTIQGTIRRFHKMGNSIGSVVIDEIASLLYIIGLPICGHKTGLGLNQYSEIFYCYSILNFLLFSPPRHLQKMQTKHFYETKETLFCLESKNFFYRKCINVQICFMYNRKVCLVRPILSIRNLVTVALSIISLAIDYRYNFYKML